MTVNLLAISVGNTRTQVGLFLDGQLTERRVLGNDRISQDMPELLRELAAPLAQAQEAVCYLATVNEPAAQRVIEAAARAPIGIAMRRIDRDAMIPIGRKLDPDATIGVDRLLNAAAAFDRAKQACIIIDAGTAVTVDFVDGEGTFHGGAILPGTRMMLSALSHNTDLLPAIEFERPVEAIGHNTAEAIRSGVFHGVRGAVRELTEKYAELYQAYPKVVATGGDAEVLFDHYDLIETLDTNLTLQGLAVTRTAVLAQEASA